MNRRYSDPLCRKTVNLDYSKPRINWCVYVCTQMLPYGLPHSVFADCELPQGGEHGPEQSFPLQDGDQGEEGLRVQGMLWARFTI